MKIDGQAEGHLHLFFAFIKHRGVGHSCFTSGKQPLVKHKKRNRKKEEVKLYP
jgi:hypothetical protein